jgi:hypothetical protein
VRSLTVAHALRRNGSGWRDPVLRVEVAERGGFEPPVEFPPHMISSHADSAWLSHLSVGENG